MPLKCAGKSRLKICQIAYFVDDVREAVPKMHQTFGAGPFLVSDNIQLAWAELRGIAGNFVHTSAYGQWGDVMMELVQQDSEGPSPFRDMFEPGQQGIHHVAVMVDSMKEAYEHFASQGFDVAAKAETTSGVEFAFIDTVEKFGHMIEIYERSEQLAAFYQYIREASTHPFSNPFIQP